MLLDFLIILLITIIFSYHEVDFKFWSFISLFGYIKLNYIIPILFMIIFKNILIIQVLTIMTGFFIGVYLNHIKKILINERYPTYLN